MLLTVRTRSITPNDPVLRMVRNWSAKSGIVGSNPTGISKVTFNIKERNINMVKKQKKNTKKIKKNTTKVHTGYCLNGSEFKELVNQTMLLNQNTHNINVNVVDNK